MRPRKCRRVRSIPIARFYKPQGIPVRQLKIIAILEEELEALRLTDQLGMEQDEAAKLMNVSRSTFSRVLSIARRHVATALVEGAALKIEGGDFQLVSGEEHQPPATELDRGG